MTIITKDELKRLLNSNDDEQIFLDPILEDDQIGNISIDLRLGYDFLVSVNTRAPYVSLNRGSNYRSPRSYFQDTRRDLGEGFLVYPGQLVLTTSLEYIRLPNDVYAEIITRSSYNRLGIRISTTLQLGFRGCVPLEIVNDSNNSVEIIVGSRMVQAKFYRIGEKLDYGVSGNRKYYGNVFPMASRAAEDKDIEKLLRIK